MEGDSIRLIDLPPELILEIGDYLSLQSLKDLNSLVRASAHFNALLSPQLYAIGARWCGPLAVAVLRCPVSSVEKLLAKGADPAEYATSSYNAFTAAIGRYRPTVLKMLLAPNVSSSVPVTQFSSALRMAVIPRRLDLLRILLDAAPGYYPDDDGAWDEALHCAVIRSRAPAARLLLEAAAKTISSPANKINEDTIYAVLYKPDLDFARLLVEFGWNVNAPVGSTTPVIFAAEVGNRDLVAFLLSAGADINTRNRYLATPLHIATIREEIATVDLLLKAGADVNATNQHGETPLHECSRTSSEQILDLLLAAGADVNVSTDGRVTPLHTAISRGRPTEMTKRLIAAGADVNALDPYSRSPVLQAAEAGRAELLQALLAAGADSTARTQQTQGTAFHLAATAGNAELVDPLLKAGLDIDEEDRLGRTPLFVATMNSSLDFMRELIRRGANPNRAAHEQSMVWCAISRNYTAGLRVLLEAGADISSPSVRDGNSILHELVATGVSREIVQLLLDNGADPHAVGPAKRTALHHAVAHGRYKLVQPLIHGGTPIEAEDDNGDTALLMASRTSCEGTRELLIYGANPNARASDGSTPLHHSSSHSDPEIYTCLITAGADITAKDESGQTPLHAAAAVGNHTICHRLIREYKTRGLDYMEPDSADRTILELAANAGTFVTIDRLVRAGADVNGGQHTRHGKHRGIPALHYAIINDKLQAMARLARHGADYSIQDLYGRTAIDWAAIDRSYTLRNLLDYNSRPGYEISSAPRTSPEDRTKVLKTSVIGLASRILEGDLVDVYKLAKCLQYLGDTESAGVVYAEVGSYCDLCKEPIPKTDMRFICKECPDVDLCAGCMTKYEQGNMRIQICQRHEFWGIVVLDQRLPQQHAPEGEELEQARSEWLQNLIERYSEGS
ncbi:ankyrin repeat-containing domain protein [Aspergillus heterothallicus]